MGFFDESVSEGSEPLTEAKLREAFKKMNEQRYPPPCGTEGNPHIMHPNRYPNGPCLNCGWYKET